MKIKLLFALAFCCVFVSCTEQCDVPEIPKKSTSIKAIIENDKTRTSVTEDGSFLWSFGDKVWLKTSTGSTIGVVTPSDDPKVATISCEEDIDEITGVAIYPHNSYYDNKKYLSPYVYLPNSYNLGSFTNNTNAIMYGTLINGVMKFQHLAGVARFKFTGVPKGVNKFELTLDKKINGEFFINTDNFIETQETTNKSERTVVLNFEPLESTSEICLYVPLPTGTYKGLELKLSNADEVVWRYSNYASNIVEKRQLILMPEVSLNIPSAPIGFENLSSRGTANCYIVSNAGKYCFRLVFGNSMRKIENATKVEVLWESKNVGSLNAGDFIKQVNLADDYITFETPANFKEGNALIAVRDANNTILWSWHIWFTDMPQEQEYYRGAGIVMDRNLGATTDDMWDYGKFGLMYQWGRKDPFLPSIKFVKGLSEVVSSTGNWNNATSNETTGTIQYSIENPTTFITADYDWLYGEDLGVNDTRWGIFKTIYDPSPPGWKVPDYTVWTTAMDMTPTWKNPYCEFDINGLFGSYDCYACIKFCDEYSFYPAQGDKVSANTVNWNGYQGCYWSCNSNISYQATQMQFDYNYKTCCLKHGIWRSIGQAIRCVKE